MADFGVKITRDGVDVSSIDPRDFVLHSNYKTLKSLFRLSTTLTWTGGEFNVSKTINHGLGYPPMFLFNLQGYDSKWYTIVGETVVQVTSTKFGLIFAYADNDDLVIAGHSSDPPASDTDLAITYYIIIDDITGL